MPGSLDGVNNKGRLLHTIIRPGTCNSFTSVKDVNHIVEDFIHRLKQELEYIKQKDVNN